jgi:hypothetical protein
VDVGLIDSHGATLHLSEMGESSIIGDVSGFTDWTYVKATYDSGSNTELTVNASLGPYGEASGTAQFDRVELIDPNGNDILSNSGFESLDNDGTPTD